MTFYNIATGETLSQCDFYALVSEEVYDCCSQSLNVWIAQPNNLAFNEYQWQQWFIANPPSCGVLTLGYQSPADIPFTLLADWNTALGSNYTSVLVAGRNVTLSGGSNVVIPTASVLAGSNLTNVSDQGSVTGIQASAFSGCALVLSYSFDSCTTVGDSAFANSTAMTSISLPACTALGSTTGDNGVFTGITGNTIAMTFNAVLETCNAGNRDGDIDAAGVSNTINVTYV